MRAWANARGVVEVLLRYDADINASTDEVDQPGKTALQIAVEAGSRHAARTLRANGAR